MRRLKRAENVDDLFNQMEKVFSEFQEKGRNFAHDFTTGFPVDIAEEGGEFVVSADMPGVEKEEINVKADAEGVEISAESSKEIEEENEKYYRRERSRKAFNRRVSFPQPVDPDTIEASYEDGVLEIRAEKDHEDGKSVDIK